MFTNCLHVSIIVKSLIRGPIHEATLYHIPPSHTIYHIPSSHSTSIFLSDTQFHYPLPPTPLTHTPTHPLPPTLHTPSLYPTITTLHTLPSPISLPLYPTHPPPTALRVYLPASPALLLPHHSTDHARPSQARMQLW